MEAARHRESIRRDGVALATAARRGLEQAIASCPGWCMADLIWHTGTAVRFGDQETRRRAGLALDGPVQIEAPTDDSLVEWFEEGAERLVATLQEADPDDMMGREWIEVGYPGPSLARHYAREVGVHRWDGETAWGEATPLHDDLAADWLDGVLTTWLPRASAQGRQAQGPWAGERILFRRTDGPERWLVTLRAPGAVEVARQDGDAELTIHGRGADLLLLAMNRITSMFPTLDVEGDADVFDRWAAEIRYGRPAAGAHWLGSPRPPEASRVNPGG